MNLFRSVGLAMARLLGLKIALDQGYGLGGLPLHQTALAMVGAKAGQNVVMCGASESHLAAALAGVTGLNGRTVVVDPSPDAQRSIEAAAADAGTLVEFQQGAWSELPAGDGAFDIAVLSHCLAPGAEQQSHVIAEARRVIREGGRLIVIEGASDRFGVFKLRRRDPRPTLAGGAICDLLAAAGLRAARVLAESEGVTYVEGFKRRA